MQTWWVRPERTESMVKASTWSRGLPRRRPSRKTMVSAAMMSADGSSAKARAASAFLRQMEETISSGERAGS